MIHCIKAYCVWLYPLVNSLPKIIYGLACCNIGIFNVSFTNYLFWCELRMGNTIMTWINNREHGLRIFPNFFLVTMNGHWISGFLITWIISKCKIFFFNILIGKYINIPFLPQKGVCGRGFNGPYSKCLALKKITLGSYPRGKIWAIMYRYTHFKILYILCWRHMHDTGLFPSFGMELGFGYGILIILQLFCG